MQHFSRIQSFMLELDRGRGAGVGYCGGELLSGRVVLDITKRLKVRMLAVCARGMATAHWLESKSIGMNTVYSDYTAYEIYLRRRHHLIRGERISSLLLCPTPVRVNGRARTLCNFTNMPDLSASATLLNSMFVSLVPQGLESSHFKHLLPRFLKKWQKPNKTTF